MALEPGGSMPHSQGLSNNNNGRYTFECPQLTPSKRGFVPHLLVGLAVVGLLPQAVDFPEDYAVRPDVRLEGEAPVHHTLWRHPPDRQQA